MTNVLLLDLGDTREEHNEPLGIECIATRLKEDKTNNVCIKWLNTGCILEELELEKYDVIGVSINIGTLRRFSKLKSLIVKNNPKAKVVAGGTIPTFGYFDFLKQYPDVICIKGEGEDAFYELTKLLASTKKWDHNELLKISGLAFSDGNKLTETELKAVSLPSLKKVYRDPQIMKFIFESNGIVRLEGSRGCSWNKCSFCCIGAKYADSNWNGFSIDKIISELVELSEYGFRSPYFTDEDFFGSDYDRAILLANKIIEYKRHGKIHKDMNFFISILANDLKSEQGKKAIIALKEAGLREVFMGIESMCKEQIKRYKKKSSIKTNHDAIQFIHSIGLQLDTGYILFDPKMTFEELEVNVSYINDISLNKLDARSLKRLRLQPLTQITTELAECRESKLDLDNLEYAYKFDDSRVELVYRLYNEWEEVLKDNVWKLQSKSRGENSDWERIRLKNLLGEIREIDFQVLKSIISNVKNELNDRELSNTMNKANNEKNIILISSRS